MNSVIKKHYPIAQEPKYRFVKEWNPLTTTIHWQIESCRQLNEIIRDYNKWQIEGFQYSERERLLALIEWGKQILDDSYYDELDSMEEFVDAQQYYLY